jgi:sulfatase maturation enzyme AslB (radical SAM superfamily)
MSTETRAGADQEIRPFLQYHLIPQLLFFTVGFPKGSFVSVDVTDQCNLRCQHCYFFEQEQEGSLDAEGWEQRLIELKKKSKFLHSCTWVGGEPLLKKNIIERCKKYFLHNLIVTNGTIPLPDWPDVYFHLSVDGNEEAHETMRRQKGLYQLMKKNCSRKELHVTAAMCVTSINVDTIEEVLEDWRTTTHLKGFMFDFYTPIEGLDDNLFIGWERRDAVLDRLIELKRTKYGDFIAMPERVLELMKSYNSKKVTDNCIFEKKGYSLTSTGEMKEKCMLGPKADCDRCGCVVPYYLHYRVEKPTILKLTADEIRRRFLRLKEEFNALTPESQRSRNGSKDATHPS